MANDSGSAWFVAGFIVGGLVGFAAGLLMAPQAGEETQAQLRERGIELKGKAEGLAEELQARKRAQEAIHLSDIEYDRTELLAELEKEMFAAAEALEFEKAAVLRDQMVELEKRFELMEKVK